VLSVAITLDKHGDNEDEDTDATRKQHCYSLRQLSFLVNSLDEGLPPSDHPFHRETSLMMRLFQHLSSSTSSNRMDG